MAQLEWYCPKRFTRHYELRRGGVSIATLTYDPAPAVQWEYSARHPATVRTDEAAWRLTTARGGFLGLKADVPVDGTTSGRLEAGYLLLRGTLSIGEAPRYRWRGSLWELGEDVFTHVEGFPVMRLSAGNYFDRVHARASLLADATPALDVVLLASVGFYVRFLMNKSYR